MRDQYSERQVQQQIINDVRQALTSLNLANATVESDSQSRLASDESSLLNAFVGYQQAYVSYERATWTLLDGLGMVLEPVRR